MDVVVRSPHGDADLSITRHEATTSLGDLIGVVTGQAVPRIALVDGRTVDAATLLDDIGLRSGSVITTEPDLPVATSDADVDVVQIAGYGAGRSRRLAPGRYRMGPGRRSGADELVVAPVEEVALEILVEATSDTSDVSIRPNGRDVAVDGVAVTTPTAWRTGTLTAGTRAFVVDSPARSDPPRVSDRPDPDGIVAFSRPPRRRSAPERRPVADALRDATLASPALWERRLDHPDAMRLPFGVRSDASGVSTVEVDLGLGRAVAAAGSERFRLALARTLIVEACTLHGPADVDLVVITSPERLAHWDWVKWLPHARLHGVPTVWSRADEIGRWTDGIATRAVPTPRAMASHRSLVVLDDASLWNRRDSALRHVVTNPPADIRLIALCDQSSHAPAVSTAVITGTADGTARLHSFTRADDLHDVLVALTETAVAADVARSMASLADIELAPPDAEQAAADPVIITELIGADGPEEILDRWNADAARSSTAGGGAVHPEVDVTDSVTVVVGTSIDDAFEVAVTSILAQCVERSPAALWVAPLIRDRRSWSDLLRLLPHATDGRESDQAIDPQRLLRRVRAVLADPNGPDRVLVVVDVGAGDEIGTDAPSHHWLSALIDGARTTSGLGLLIISDRPDAVHPPAATLIRVERRAGANADVRAATITPGGGATSWPLVTLQPGTATVGPLELRPNVLGRALTPLERRIDQRHARTANAPHPDLARAVDLLRVAASRAGDELVAHDHLDRLAVPPPLPRRVDLDALFESSPGDGVPLGLVDDPAAASTRTWWWEPTNGSLLLFGSRRSGVEQALTTIVLGVVDRFAPADVRLVVIEASSGRRRALAGLGHMVRAISPDRTDEVEAVFREIETDLARHAPDGRPRTVLLIDDLVQLRRHVAGHPLGSLIDAVLSTANRVDAGVDVIAYAGDLAGAGPFALAASRRVVGTSSDDRDLSALGVERPADLDGIVGRCRTFPGGDLVQLATSETPVDTLLARRSSAAGA